MLFRSTVLDTAVEGTAASATGGVVAALAESALLCHVEHARVFSNGPRFSID